MYTKYCKFLVEGAPTLFEGHFTLESLWTLDLWYTIMWLVEKPKMVQVYFTLDFEGLKDQRYAIGWIIYMASYMAPSGKYFMVYQILW